VDRDKNHSHLTTSVQNVVLEHSYNHLTDIFTQDLGKLAQESHLKYYPM